jgi:hypothetical protein
MWVKQCGRFSGFQMQEVCTEILAGEVTIREPLIGKCFTAAPAERAVVGPGGGTKTKREILKLWPEKQGSDSSSSPLWFLTTPYLPYLPSRSQLPIPRLRLRT